MAAPKGLCRCRMPRAECVCDDDETSERSARNMGKPVTDEEIEQEIRDKRLTAPRVTPESIEALIIGDDYHVFPGTTVTVCCLELRNGYRVIGQSAAASPENFDADLGRKIARADAFGKIWALEGYLLREKLSQR